MKYFDLVKFTYLENWPPSLCSLSIPQVDIPLGLIGTMQLQKEIESAWYELEQGRRSIPSLFGNQLIGLIDAALNKFPSGAGFVRLGSRSPKDSILFHDTRGKVQSGAQALMLLTNFSERIWEDLYLAIEEKYPVHIFVREWQEIQPWAEFRCFMRDHRLVGISQYDYLSGYMPEISSQEGSIRFAIEQFFKRFKENWPIDSFDDVVFDVFLRQHRAPKNETSWEVRLLEINPWMERTDPCLFSWLNDGDFDSGFRFIKEK